ncbi:MAG: M28 family peptidase [Bacteroidota bacterium]
MRKLIFILFLIPSIISWSQPASKKKEKKNTPEFFAKTIAVPDLKKHLYIIASKEMEGRETASEGQRKAAAYIEEQFRSLGLLPGNKGSYQYNYPIYQDSLLNTSIEINDQSFELDKDFSINVSQNNTTTFRFSEIVFVGNGEVNDTKDDYKGLDVRGKAVLVLGSPLSLSNSSRFPNLKLEAAKKNGATAVLYIGSGYPKKTKTESKSSMYLNYFKNSISPNQFIISEKMAETIMGEDDLANAKKGNIQPKTYSANIILGYSKTTLSLHSSNVMGLLEGTDLKDEYVYITAHYDHLGKRDTVIYYGADDDGSGTTGVLEIAEAFVKAKAAGKGPRRSIVFMTVSGEEKGLLGSEYYTDHPVYPFGKTTVDLNIDMIGRSDASRKQGDSSNYIYVVGDDKISTDLKTISESINKKYTNLELDYKFNDPNDRQRIYFRSDHYNFARKGVPIIFYYDGMLGADYHKPTDTPDKINYELMAKRAQLVFHTAWDMANRNEMLKRDIKLEVPRGF